MQYSKSFDREIFHRLENLLNIAQLLNFSSDVLARLVYSEHEVFTLIINNNMYISPVVRNSSYVLRYCCCNKKAR